MAGTIRKRVNHDFRDIAFGLNGVRPRWPEQCYGTWGFCHAIFVSMESGLDGRNNPYAPAGRPPARIVSMESGLDGRNN